MRILPTPPRRHFPANSLIAGTALRSCFAADRKSKRPPRVLLHSSWQTVNIGDVGHSPGAITLLDKYFPEAEITLWPRRLNDAARAMLVKGYPRLKIIEGTLARDNK